ncbi:very-short-patch-repair endonuclease [Mycolicibacterium sp. BK634]|nr:very-short-patch-repair endonuclease [Mycolicibacterium sp. BK634]
MRFGDLHAHSTQSTAWRASTRSVEPCLRESIGVRDTLDSGRMERPFVGSRALANGDVANKYRLRNSYRAVFPDVYLPNDSTVPTLRQRTEAAWLWSGQQGIVSGVAASALHGAKWVHDDAAIDLNHANPRAPRGIMTHRDALSPEERVLIAGMPVTTPARTAFDLGRWLARNDAVGRLDALGRASGFSQEEVLEVMRRHPGSRHVRRLNAALALHDPGAQSPQETWLRLLVIDAKYPRPRTQIPIDCGDGYPRYFLDMGWEDAMIAVEYDGAHHRSDPEQARHDIVRHEVLAELGWIVIRVVAGMHRTEILRRLDRAWSSSVRTERRIA